MKAQELRLGNLGSTKYDGVLLTGKVISISDGRIVMYLETNDKDYVECHISPFDFKPIPLTDEWLVKLGFKKSKGKGLKEFILGDFICYTYIKDTVEVYYGIQCEVKIQYVHQLQNLYYALTQKEL